MAGQSRGFGFVHMDNADSAGNAAAGMHGKMMDGRALVVRLRSEGPGGKPDRPRGFGPAENDESKVGLSSTLQPPKVVLSSAQGSPLASNAQ